MWLRFFILPFAAVVSSVSAAFPFPLAELLVPTLFLYAATGIPAALRGRFLRLLVRSGRILLFLAIIYFLAWMPAYLCGSSDDFPVPADRLEPLCRTLISDLNDSGLGFPEPETSLRLAETAVSTFTGTPLPERSVKAARYPEWMDFFGLAGFYSPWTGEAIIHPDLSPAALPTLSL